jgi:hypothetical protein
MYVRVHACICMLYICMCAYFSWVSLLNMHVCTIVHECMSCVCIYIYIYIHTHTNVYIQICMDLPPTVHVVCMCVYIHNIYTRSYTYMRRHTHRNIAVLLSFRYPRIIQPSNYSTLELFNPRIIQPSNYSTLELFNPRIIQPSNYSTLELFNPRIIQPSNYSTLELFNPRIIQPFNDICNTYTHTQDFDIHTHVFMCLYKYTRHI